MSRADGNGHRVAIIGVGSPFGDDRLGWVAVDWLERNELHKRFHDRQFTYSSVDRPGASLLEQLRGVDGAIIIDAMQTGLPAGTPRAFTLEALLAHPAVLLSSHAFGVSESLALGAALGELPEALLIVGIEMGAALHETGCLESNFRQLVTLVEAFLLSTP